jgi:hypothetical protein
MKFIKKNIGAIIAIVIIILLLIGAYFVKEMFFSTDTEAIYGNRLDGIDKVKIGNDKEKQLKDNLKEGTEKVSMRLAGKIVYISIVVNGDTSLDAAKGLGNKALESFSDEEKAFYDFQILIQKNSDSKQFPIIGYKQHSRASITWTKDRAEN